MRKMVMLFAVSIILFSCGSNEENKTEAKTEETTAAVTSNKPAFTSFDVVTVQHKVKDFDKWLPGFNADDSARRVHGLAVLSVGRFLDDPNTVYIGIKASDIAKAKEFVSSPALKDVMQKAGVVGTPTISYIKVIRYDSTNMSFSQRAVVSYHVKDFDAWLKFYDEKGTATREQHGLMDLGLARGVDNPNIVYIQFGISDIEKAKARLNSPELKTILAEGGVDSDPVISIYKLVQ